MNKNKHYVFCYGTLKKHNRNHYRMHNATYIGNARLHNVDMIDLGTYPGLIAGNHSIVGEVYCVDEDKKKELDIFEEVGTLYNDKTSIVSIDGKEYLIHYYEMIPDGKTYPLCPDEESYYRVDPYTYIWIMFEDSSVEMYFEEHAQEAWLKKEKNAYLIKEKIVDTIFHGFMKTYIKTNYDNVKMYIYKKSLF